MMAKNKNNKKNNTVTVRLQELVPMLRAAPVLPSSRARRNRRRRQRNALLGAQGLTPVDCAYMRAAVVPFSTDAYGAKIPDSYAFPTSTTVSKSSFNVTGYSATGSQYGVWAFTPYEEAAEVTAASVTATGVVNWTGATPTFSAISTSMFQIASNYRAAGGGIRITTNTALTSASGYIWVLHIPLKGFTSIFSAATDWPTNEANCAQFPLAEKYTLAELAEAPLVVPFRRISDSSMQWRTPAAGAGLATTGGTYSDLGWCGVIVYMNSGQTAAALSLNVERVNHLEYIPDPQGSTYFGIGDGVPEPINRVVLDETVNISQMTPTAYLESKDHDEETLFKKVVSAAGRVATLVANSQTGRRALNGLLSVATHRANRAITSFIGAQEEMKGYDMIDY